MKIIFRDLIKRFNLSSADRVLDVGGSGKQLTEIKVDTLADIVRPEGRLLAKHFEKLDFGKDKFPFPNKYFDFVFCGHTIEDLYDPRLAVSEMARVAKRGLFVTPSRGREMEYTKFDVTDWLTGGVRVPGHAHHHWFVENKDQALRITPKHYPLLYSPEFQVTKWNGPVECEYYWEGTPRIKFFDDINFRHLLTNYRDFVAANSQNIKIGRTLVWIDHPLNYVIAYWKILRRKGNAYILK